MLERIDSWKLFLRLTYSYANGNRVTPTQLIGTGLVKARCIYSAGSNGRKVFTIHKLCQSTDWHLLFTTLHHQSKVPGDTPPTEASLISAKCLQLQC